jgi:NTE family protein
MNFTNETKIGLVLSGGGAKGIAHAGVLKYLEEKKIYPTEIAGTSSGALVAALYGWGLTPEEILQFFKSVYFFNWKHFSFKGKGLVSSSAFETYFEQIFGDAIIGDLKIPTHITATDMVHGRLKVFEPEIRIVDAILASTAVPGIISPHIINSRIYSDGGILNHFPVDLLSKDMEFVIGVYVSPLQMVEPTQLKSIRAITRRAFNLLSANCNFQKFELCDWFIQPEELVNYLTFETNKQRMDEIYQIGYEYAKKQYCNMEYSIGC